VRVAGRVKRQVEVLRQVAHEISPDPDRVDRPTSGDEAHERLLALISGLQKTAPRVGLGAADGCFIDHVAGVAGRYGRNLFYCFDDDRIPATTNGLEGFYGASKGQLRHALGNARTSNGVAQNLGAHYLLAFARTRASSARDRQEAIATLTVTDYESARRQLEAAEVPARTRRSRRRAPKRHLDHLLTRWRAGP